MRTATCHHRQTRPSAAVVVAALAGAILSLVPPASQGQEPPPAAPRGDAKAWKKLRETAQQALEANQYQQAERDFLAALAQAEGFKATDERLGESLWDLGSFYRRMGRFKQAEPLLRRALEAKGSRVGTNDVPVVPFLMAVAHVCDLQAKFAEAEPLLLRAKHLCEVRLGADRVGTALAFAALADHYFLQGKYEPAEELYVRALRITENTRAVTGIGPWGDVETRYFRADPNRTLELLHRLGLMNDARNKNEAAEDYYQRALKLREKLAGKDSPYLASTLNELADFYLKLKKLPEAEQALKRSVACLDKNQNPDLRYLADALRMLVAVTGARGEKAAAAQYRARLAGIKEQVPVIRRSFVPGADLDQQARQWLRAGQLAEAEELLLRLLAWRQEALGKTNPLVAPTLRDLGRLRLEQSRLADAETLFQQALVLQRASAATEPRDLAATLRASAECSLRQKKHAEAGAAYEQLLAAEEQALGKEDPALLSTLRLVAAFYREANQETPLAAVLERTIALKEKEAGPEDMATARAVQELADLHLGAGRLVQATPLYLRVLAAQEKSYGPTNNLLLPTVSKLVALYNQQGGNPELERLYPRLVGLTEGTFGADAPRLAMVLEEYAKWLNKQNRADEAAKAEERAKAIRAATAK